MHKPTKKQAEFLAAVRNRKPEMYKFSDDPELGARLRAQRRTKFFAILLLICGAVLAIIVVLKVIF